MPTSLSDVLVDLHPAICIDGVEDRINDGLYTFDPRGLILTTADIWRWLARLEYHLACPSLRRTFPFHQRRQWLADAYRRAQQIYGKTPEYVLEERLCGEVEGGRRAVMQDFAAHMAKEHTQEWIRDRVDSFVGSLSTDRYKLVRALYIRRFGRLMPTNVRKRIDRGHPPPLSKLLQMHPYLIYRMRRFYP